MAPRDFFPDPRGYLPDLRPTLTARPGLAPGRGTAALGAVAVAVTIGAVALEWARVWHRGSAPLPSATDDTLAASVEAAQETLQVVREGYRMTPPKENAVFNMLGAFAVTLGAARGTTALIHAGRRLPLMGDLVIGDRHIHHFVPGLAMTLGAGGAAIATKSAEVDRWLALPFGAGAALVLDEAALLLELDDVYWTEEGVLSLQLSFATLAGLGVLALTARLLQRGESEVLDG